MQRLQIAMGMRVIACALFLVLTTFSCSETTPQDGGVSDAACESSPSCVRTATPFPVCGTDYVSYRNPGFAACACAGVLHNGNCLANEGASCSGAMCSAGQTCRMSTLRCTQIGACLDASDCPAGLTGTDGGAPPTRCVDHACVE